MISPSTSVAVLWGTWLLIWWLAALRTARTVIHQSPGSRLAHSVWIWGGALLLFMDARRLRPPLTTPLPTTAWIGWVGAALVAAGLGYAIWARVHLGRFWSATVTLKAEHLLIRTGPYTITRHPIYTGLLLALIGSVLVRGNVAGVAGFGLVAIGLMLKVRQEERLLTEHFGEDYRAYQAEVPAVVPGFGRGGAT
jgi:protein-S-isoprenylcysteine O-methyltransferase Ste14